MRNIKLEHASLLDKVYYIIGAEIKYGVIVAIDEDMCGEMCCTIQDENSGVEVYNITQVFRDVDDAEELLLEVLYSKLEQKNKELEYHNKMVKETLKNINMLNARIKELKR